MLMAALALETSSAMVLSAPASLAFVASISSPAALVPSAVTCPVLFTPTNAPSSGSQKILWSTGQRDHPTPARDQQRSYARGGRLLYVTFHVKPPALGRKFGKRAGPRRREARLQCNLPPAKPTAQTSTSCGTDKTP